MKNLITLLAFLLLSQLVSAKILTVSNYYNTPGQYNNLQTAVTAANSGDTIFVHASNVQYPGVTINKQLTIFGAGYNGTLYQNSTLISNVAYITLTNNGIASRADGSKIAGLRLNYLQTSGSDTFKNVIVERCLIGYMYTNNNTINAATNWIIRDNLLGTGNGSALYLNTDNNIIENNIIYSTYYGPFSVGTGVAGNIITNNIILTTVNLALTSVNTTILTNNIFYSLSNSGNTLSFGTGNTLNNNITYNMTGSLPGAGNSGSGNLIQTDPKFTNPPAAGTSPVIDSLASKTYNWHLNTSSPGHNYGTDGTDLSIYGGPFPVQNLYGVTILPQITKMNILNSSLPSNGTLNVNVTGIKRN